MFKVGAKMGHPVLVEQVDVGRSSKGNGKGIDKAKTEADSLRE